MSRARFKFKILPLLAVCCLVVSARAQTPVLFPLAQMTGTTNDTTLTVRPVFNPVRWKNQVYWLPNTGIQLKTVNGSVTTNLIPNDYFITVTGAPGSWRISVTDTNTVLNAAQIGTLTVYTFSQTLPGVNKIIAGSGASVSPSSGQGDVTVSLLNGTGTGNVTGTNATVIGDLVMWIAVDGTLIGDASVPVSSLVFEVAFQNFTNSLKSAAFHLATDFDPSGSASAATNGWPWGTLYDAAGAASAATNGYPWSSLYDAANSARNATNGYPWGTLYDAAGAASAATNGYPWGSLYDAANSARNATNGYPWGTLYDPANSARNATNGYPWGSLYDAAGTASAATNGLSLSSGLAAFRGTNTFAATNAATTSTLGLVKPDGSTITITSDGTISSVGGGGGSQTPLTSDINMQGHSETNGGNVVVNSLNSTYRAPFTNATFLIVAGNSRASDTFNPWKHWGEYLATNYFAASGYIVRYTNFGVAGHVVEQDTASFSTTIHTCATGGGTNTWVFYMDPVNNAIQHSNVQASINSISNEFWSVKNDNDTLVGFTAFEPSPAQIDEPGLVILAQLNDYVRTNVFCDYVVDTASFMSSTKLSGDGLHQLPAGDILIAKHVYRTITGGLGSSSSVAQDGHFTPSVQIYDDGTYTPSLRGRNGELLIQGSNPAAIFDYGSGGAAWVGLYLGRLNVWVTNNNSNIPALNGIEIGPGFFQVDGNSGVTGYLAATNGFGSVAADSSIACGSAGLTNTLKVNYRVMGFTGTSVVQTNTSTTVNFSRGTITTPTDIILQPNEALRGSSCAAQAVQAF